VDPVEDFLADHDGRVIPWIKPAGAPTSLKPDRVLIGENDNTLEIAVALCVPAHARPRVENLRALWKKRRGDRASPVLLVVLYESDPGRPLAAVVGPTGDPSPILDLPASKVARIASAALREPNRHAATRMLDRYLAGLKDHLIPGLRNSGLFASHELRIGVPRRPDWAAARTTAQPLLNRYGQPLIHALGYDIAPRGSGALLLSQRGTRRAVAVLLDETDVFDRPSGRFVDSPVAHGLDVAHREGLPWLIVLRGTQIRLYPTKPDVGVGQKGLDETYIELELALLSDEDGAYLPLLFSPDALAPGGSVGQILAASANFAADLGDRLRERVYDKVIRGLALAIAARTKPDTEQKLSDAYSLSLLVLFRLLFVAYAEDRGLLPYGRNPRYDHHAIKSVARDFTKDPAPRFDKQATSLWTGIKTVWTAIDNGNTYWSVPQYNGGLFSSDPREHQLGAALAKMELTDAEFGPVLRALLVDIGEDGVWGPVDFRSLKVREFGALFEGLLESSLSVAPTDLTMDATGSYVPASADDEPSVRAGEVYIRSKSGKRKSTGSYFTKRFAVEHLLDRALDPVLDAHLARVKALVDAGDDAAASDAFFDFRVVDLAMGSGHFLVAAIDRIEMKFAAFLAEHSIPTVSHKLTELGRQARDNLGDQASKVEIEPGALLRRQIAGRCIYGMDVNPLAVELARLSLWIHTFVPGLPMGNLHGVVQGNSLTGIGTLDEVLDVLDPQRGPGEISLFAENLKAALDEARVRLRRLATTLEATKKEVSHAGRAHEKALEKAQPAKLLCDAAIAVRLGLMPPQFTPKAAIDRASDKKVQRELETLEAVHLPVQFPDVFIWERPGFDVVLGNPPWEKVKVEEHQWWALRFPGLRSLSQKDKNAAISRYQRERPDLRAEHTAEVAKVEAMKNALGKGRFPGLRAGTDTDLSFAFAWRYWYALRTGGRAGVVLSRGALGGRAGAQWRQTILNEGGFDDVTILSNSRGWIFDEVHPQYTIGLVSFAKEEAHVGQVTMRGPYFSLQEYKSGVNRPTCQLLAHEFTTWVDGAAFPLMPHANSLEVFLKLRSHPRLDTQDGPWQFVPLRELHTTDNKALFDFDLGHPGGDMPILSGRSINLWNPDHGDPYGYTKSTVVIRWLQERRRRQIRLPSSALHGMPAAWAIDPDTLPCHYPRIAFRNVARAIDSRTIICSLVPPGVVLVELCPYLFRKQGDSSDEAFLLGILSSIPLDWYARRYVEKHVTIGLLNTFPIPHLVRESPLWKRIVNVAGRLAAVDGRYTTWAAKVGVPVASVTDRVTKDDLTAELDALVSLAYGLDRSDVVHIFATFQRGWDHTDRLTAVLRHYDRWHSGMEGAA
jgi:hypothetical protein